MYLSNPEATFKRLDQAVTAARSEQAAVNEILRTLQALGMARALVQTPEVHETRYDGSTLRLYVWRDTPYQDDIVLAAGPQFQSKIALGETIPVTNEVGLFIKGVLMDRRVRTLADAEAMLAKAEARAARAAEKAAAPKRPRGRPAKSAEEKAETKAAAKQAKAAAKAAADAAAKAAEDAARAAAEVKEKKRRGRPKKEVQVAESKAQEAAAVAQEAAAVAEEAATEAIEIAAETTTSAPAVDMTAAGREMDIFMDMLERKLKGGA